jgi:nicotinamide riboside transporter PnuC
MLDLETISQIAIAILGVTAITLIAKKNRWGFVIGLISQPFWLYSSYENKQWGIFLLSVIYIFSWAFGIYEWFFKNKKNDK